MKDLTPRLRSDPTNVFDVLAHTRAEALWLANFTSANTRGVYRAALGDFIATMCIDSPDALYGVTQSHVVAFREALRERGLSNATVANRLAALSSLYAFLADKQLCETNPVAGVKRPATGGSGVGAGKTPALTAEQARAMLDAPLTLKGQRDVPELQKLRDSAILHVFFYTGGRVSEPGSLRVRDFRLDREYWVLEMHTKGDRGNIVAIHTDCQAAIRRYLAASGHRDQPDAPLFLAARAGQNSGQPLGRGTFHDLFKKYARLAGLPPSITPHSARSTFITQSLEVGVPIRDVQATVNHASVTTTETYAHTAKKHRNSASLRVVY